MRSVFVKLSPQEIYRNITDDIRMIVRELDIKEGLLSVKVMHTTCALLIQEDEPCLMKDLFRRLDILFPRSESGSPPGGPAYYSHDDFSVRTQNLNGDKCAERINGHAHCRASLLPYSVNLWVIDGKIDLGRYQQILFLDFDDIGGRKEREVRIALVAQT